MGEPSHGFRPLHRRVPGSTDANAVVVVVACLIVVVAAGVAAVAVLRDGPVAVYGTGFAVALAALALAVRRFFAGVYPHVIAAEERSIGGDTDAPLTDIEPVNRRTALGRILGTAAFVVTAGLLAPIASLGPRRRGIGYGTAWRSGVRLVNAEGRALREGDVPAGGLATVWPEGSERQETSAVVLVRLGGRPPAPPTNLDWVVGGALVAYSKVCTHMGCPVGLFQEGSDTLFCPCHQAAFDASRGARPTFGPPPRPLPQLPLGVDDGGYLIALDDFAERVGPAVG
jgi:ubiquinol-cytochrome c reductase iron-sulfur subunit